MRTAALILLVLGTVCLLTFAVLAFRIPSPRDIELFFSAMVRALVPFFFGLVLLTAGLALRRVAADADGTPPTLQGEAPAGQPAWVSWAMIVSGGIAIVGYAVYLLGQFRAMQGDPHGFPGMFRSDFLMLFLASWVQAAAIGGVLIGAGIYFLRRGRGNRR